MFEKLFLISVCVTGTPPILGITSMGRVVEPV